MTALISRARLPELDALRGIAAVGVVAYHYATRFHEMFPAAHHIPVGFAFGHNAVLLFFAISGFVIAFTMEKLERASDFIVKRFARLYPAYWAAMLLTLGIEYATRTSALQVSPTAALANITMLQSFAYLPSVDGVYWTLSLELSFYACMLAIWLAGWMQWIERVIIGWLALAVLAWAWVDFPTRVGLLFVVAYIPFFAIGMLSYRIWAGERSWKQQLPYLAAVLTTIAIIGSHEAVVVAAGLCAMFAALVAGRLRFLAVGPLLWLGTISYSLYLVHHNIGFVVMLQAEKAGFGPWVGYGLALMVALGCSLLVNRCIEQPVARLIGDFWTQWRTSWLATKPPHRVASDAIEAPVSMPQPPVAVSRWRLPQHP